MDETHMQRKMEVRHFGLGLKGRDLRQNHRRPQGRSQHTMERVIGSVKYVRSLSLPSSEEERLPRTKISIGCSLALDALAIKPALSRNVGHGSHCKGVCQV